MSAAHHPKFGSCTELDERRQQLMREWQLRKCIGFVAVDPRTLYQREGGAEYLKRQRFYSRLWLRVLKMRIEQAARTANGLPPRRPQLRLISGGCL